MSARALAAAAGVTGPLLFYYFPTKADLYLATVQAQVDVLHAELVHASATGTAVMRLHGFVRTYHGCLRDRSAASGLILHAPFGVPEAITGQIAVAYHTGVVAPLEAILRCGVAEGVVPAMDVAMAVRVILGIVHATARGPLYPSATTLPVQVVMQAVGAYLAGMTPREMADMGRTEVAVQTTGGGNAPVSVK